MSLNTGEHNISNTIDTKLIAQELVRVLNNYYKINITDRNRKKTYVNARCILVYYLWERFQDKKSLVTGRKRIKGITFAYLAKLIYKNPAKHDLIFYLLKVSKERIIYDRDFRLEYESFTRNNLITSSNSALYFHIQRIKESEEQILHLNLSSEIIKAAYKKSYEQSAFKVNYLSQQMALDFLKFIDTSPIVEVYLKNTKLYPDKNNNETAEDLRRLQLFELFIKYHYD